MNPSEDRSWFAVRIRTGWEFRICSILQQKGYETFLPSYRQEVGRGRRTVKDQRALFPGYTFCLMNPRNQMPLLVTPGVIGFVTFGSGTLIPVEETEIERIRRMVDSGLRISPWQRIEPGEAVRLIDGPLADLEGIAVEIKGEYRLIVAVPMLQRYVNVEIERSWVQSVAPRKTVRRAQPLVLRASHS